MPAKHGKTGASPTGCGFSREGPSSIQNAQIERPSVCIAREDHNLKGPVLALDTKDNHNHNVEQLPILQIAEPIYYL